MLRMFCIISPFPCALVKALLQTQLHHVYIAKKSGLSIIHLAANQVSLIPYSNYRNWVCQLHDTSGYYCTEI